MAREIDCWAKNVTKTMALIITIHTERDSKYWYYYISKCWNEVQMPGTFVFHPLGINLQNLKNSWNNTEQQATLLSLLVHDSEVFHFYKFAKLQTKFYIWFQKEVKYKWENLFKRTTRSTWKVKSVQVP